MTHLSGDHKHGLSVLHGESDEQVDEILRALDGDAVSRPVVIERAPRVAVVRCCIQEGGVFAALEAHNMTVVWPAIYRDGVEIYTVLALSRTRLDALLERLREIGDVQLERVADVSPDALKVSVSLADLTSGLTQRQLDILRRAIDQGYYNSPRRVQLEALARSFGISRSTLDEHLRKAERTLLHAFGEVLSADPAYASSATRGPGRPAKRHGERPPSSPSPRPRAELGREPTRPQA